MAMESETGSSAAASQTHADASASGATPSPAAQVAGAPPRTVIAAGTTLKGSIEGADAVTIEGSIEGAIEARRLEVAPEASVRGRVEVGELESRGQLSGEIRARVARLSGKLADGTALFADTLEVRLPADDSGEPGLTLGHCTLEVGVDPSPSRDLPG
jgi:hypothetical protein